MSKMEPGSLEAFRTGMERGENWAFELLYERAVPPAQAFLRGKRVPEDDLQNLIQQSAEVVLIKAHRGTLQIKNSVEAYFMEVVKFNLKKFWERRGYKEEVMDDDHWKHYQPLAPDPLEEWEAHTERMALLQKGMARLANKDCEQYIILHHGGEISQKELAEELGIPYDAFRQKLSRCTRELKKIIKDITKQTT